MLAVRRRGKQLWLELGDMRGGGCTGCLLLHFGMTGAVIVRGVAAPLYKSFDNPNPNPHPHPHPHPNHDPHPHPGADCYYDLRAMNSSKGDKFDAFWVEVSKYLRLDVGEGSHERRAAGSENVSFAPTTISIPSMVREVTKRLHSRPGSEDAPIPTLEWVRLRFTPNDPFRLASGSATGMLNFQRRIQARAPPPPPPT